MLHRKQDGNWWRQINDPPYWAPLGPAETAPRWYYTFSCASDDYEEITRTMLGESPERVAVAVAILLGEGAADWIGRNPFQEDLWMIYREQPDGTLFLVASVRIQPEAES